MASDTFSQYLAQARAARGLDPKTGAATGSLANSSGTTGSKLTDVQKEAIRKARGSGTQQNLDPLSRLVAGLSTPLYAITNIPNQVLTEINKAQDAAKAGRQFDIMGAIGNIATAPVRGLGAGLATALGSGGNVDDMASGSNLIEKATDVIGKASDSNYQDVANNANTVAAGIGGFGLDVLLDPLTYATLGGSAAIKAGELGAKAAEAGATEAAKVGAKSLAANPLTYASLGALPAGRGIAKGASSLAGMAKGAVSAKLGEEAARLAAASRLAEGGDIAALTEREAAAQAVPNQQAYLDELATERLTQDVTPTHVPTTTAEIVTGDSAMATIRKAASDEAAAAGKYPMVHGPAELKNAVSAQYKSLFDEFKATNPELATKFKNSDDYWTYLESKAVGVTSSHTTSLDPIVQASNKLYASRVLGVPEDGYLQLYRNAIHGDESPQKAAAGYASLDKNMAWDYRSTRPERQGQFNGRYTINVKPDEVSGLIGFSHAADEFAVTVSPEITSIPGRIQRVGDLETQKLASYIDDTKTFDRSSGGSPHRGFSIASQFDLIPVAKEVLPGNSWADFAEAYGLEKGALLAKFEELYGPGSLDAMRASAKTQPTYAWLKELFVSTPDGMWGFDPRYLEQIRYKSPAEFEFAMKLLAAVNELIPNKFMVPKGTGLAGATEAIAVTKAPTIAEQTILSKIPEFASAKAAQISVPIGAGGGTAPLLEGLRTMFSGLRRERSYFGKVLTKDQWKAAAKEEARTLRSKAASGLKLTEDESALMRSIDNMGATDRMYQKYVITAREKAGYSDLYGREVMGPASVQSTQGWLTYKIGHGDEPVASIGGKYLKASEIKAATAASSKLYSKEDKAAIKAQVEAAFAEDKAAVDAALNPAERQGFDIAAEFRKQASEPSSQAGALWTNFLGAGFVNNLLKTGLTESGTDARLLQRLNVIENLITDPAALDDLNRAVVNGEETTAQFLQRIAKLDPSLSDIPSYNLEVRQAVSNVNDAARTAAIKKASSGKDDLREYCAVMYPGVPAHLRDDVVNNVSEFGIGRIELQNMEFITNTGALKSEELLGEGKAFRETEMNQFDGLDLIKLAWKNVYARVNELNLFGEARSNMIKSMMTTELAMSEHVLDTIGIPFSIRNFDVPDPLSAPVTLLSPSQLIALIDSSNPALANKLFFNAGTAAPFTRIADTIISFIESEGKLTRAQFDDLVTGQIEYTRSAATASPEAIKARLAREPKGFRKGGSYNKAADKETGKISDPAQKLRDEFWDILPKVAQGAEDTHLANLKAFSDRFGTEWQQLVNKNYEELAALSSDVTRIEDAVNVVHQLKQMIHSQSRDSGVLNLSEIKALETVLGTIPSVITRVSKAADNGAKAANAAERGLLKMPRSRKKPVTVEEIDKVRSEAAQPHKIQGTNAAAEEAGKVFEESKLADPEIRVESATAQESMKAAVELDGAVARRIAPLTTAVTRGRTMLDNLAEKFNPFYKRGRLEGARHSAVNTMYEARNIYKWKLSGIATTHSAEDIAQVFSDIQHGLGPTAGKEDLYKSLLEVTDEIHATGEKMALTSDALLRDADSLDKINDYLVRAGLKEHVYDKEVINDLMRKNPGLSFAEAASRSWMTQSITDPMDYLARRQYALLEMTMHEGIANRFLELVMRNGWISEGPAAGYISAGELANRNYLYQFLPKNAHIDARLMEELDMVDRVLQESRTPSGALGEFVDKVYTPFLGIWKSGVTYMRPGHHFRNQFGAMSLQFFSNGLKNMHRANMMALKVIGTNKTYEGFDIYASLRAAGEVKKVLGGDVMFKTPFGDLTNNQIYEAAQRFGLMPTIAAAEDVIAGSTNKLADILKKGLLQDSKYEKFMSKASELRDHHNRLSSFIQILLNEKDSGKFKSLEDLMNYAATRTKKFNPDSNMLTPFEARTMRLVFPFYTWFRGILPAIAETTFMRPGRFMVFPKASYALAYSMGINPDSLYDPFPQDQMFPSFLKDQIQGPVAKVFGNYVGFNPGVATFDVLNTFGADPVHGIAGMVTPFVRVPAELVGGIQWSTQSKIKDMSDYIDAQIPGAGYIGSITGYSPTGTIGGLLTGQGPQETYQQAAGNSSTMDKMFSAGNWLTGLGLQDYSKPNYINLAEIEKRNQAAQQKKAGQ